MLSKIKFLIEFSKQYMRVAKNGLALREIRNPHYLICKKAVENNSYAIKSVPPKHKTNELFLIAVQNNGDTLQFVPPQYRRTLFNCY